MRSISPALAQKMKTDSPGYSKRYFKIKDKSGTLVPFELNSPQMIIWEELKTMLAEGKPIRVVILKARQYGISTFM